MYATLETCAPGARSITKLGCAERIVNARIKKVYIGIEDPDPKVKGNGIAFLNKNHINIDFFDKDLQETILKANENFLKEASERAKIAEQGELDLAYTELDNILEDFNIKDFSNDALEKFRENLQINYAIESSDFKSVLRKWNFIRINSKSNTAKPTGMGILLFGQKPQVQYPQSLLKFTVKTHTENKPKILDFDGPLVLMPEKIESFLEINFPKAIDRSTFARKEINELYFEVLREVIINAIVHRDYTIEQANINVKIDYDKIIIESPGKPLVAMERLKDFTAPTFSVNPKIANVFYQMKFIEKRNMGMEELQEFANLMGVNKPIIEYVEPYLIVTLFRKAENKKEVALNLILEFVKANEKISTGDYVKKFGGSTKTASRALNNFVEKGFLDRLGEKKGTRYFIKK
jgi:ATP-dependent DNA helicase RecG